MLHYMLSGNFDTEKKTSSVNLLKTRGKRVTAEITVPREILMKHLRVAPEQIAYGQQISTLSAILTNSQTTPTTLLMHWLHCIWLPDRT